MTYEPIEREVRNLDQLGEGPAETIVIDGRRVFLYIREFPTQAASFEDAISCPEDLRRFHVAWCAVLKRMKDAGRFDRFVASERVDEPFGVALETAGGDWICGDAELLVCRVCLRHLNWRSFTAVRKKERNIIVARFSRREFLETEVPRFAEIPSKRDTSPPAMGYAADWAKRSRAHREAARWRCEGCGVDCSTRRSLLDTHHRNGVASDNAAHNLRALCKLCHADEHPNWYRVGPADQIRIEELRRAQRLRLR